MIPSTVTKDHFAAILANTPDIPPEWEDWVFMKNLNGLAAHLRAERHGDDGDEYMDVEINSDGSVWVEASGLLKIAADREIAGPGDLGRSIRAAAARAGMTGWEVQDGQA